jgi:hypothetical protein
VLNRPFPKRLAFIFIAMMLGIIVLLLAPTFFFIDVDNADVLVYQTNGCSCGEDWIGHLKSGGYSVKVKKVVFISAVRKKYGIPKGYSSCHTAIAGKYFIEGHVPIDSVKAFLMVRPNVAGIALPGKTDKQNPQVVEVGLPEVVVVYNFDGSYRVFDPG